MPECVIHELLLKQRLKVVVKTPEGLQDQFPFDSPGDFKSILAAAILKVRMRTQYKHHDLAVLEEREPLGLE